MTTKLASNQINTNPIRTFATMASAIADTTLNVGDVLLIQDRANSLWDVVLSSGVTENSYNIVQCTGVATLSLTLRINDVVDVKALGAVGDKAADDTLVIQHAFTLGKSVYLSEGRYRMTDDLDPRALGWSSNGRKLFGAGVGESSLWFYGGVNGVFMDNEGSHYHDFSIFNGVWVDAYTGVEATDRLNITAGTYGLKMGRSHMSVDNIEIQGFDYGFYSRSRYYKGIHGIKAIYNNHGLYADGVDATPPQYDHFYSCEFVANYKANCYITRGQGWSFRDCSFEGCTDNDIDMANYPYGGVYIGASASAVFDNCWIERANIFLDGPCTVNAGNWRTTACRFPQDVKRVLGQRSSPNLLDPIFYPSPSWPDTSGTQSITKANTQLDDGKRYIIISDTTGAGSSKQYYSNYNTLVRGIEYTPGNLDGWHYVGLWVQFKTADIARFDVTVEYTDSNGTVFENDTHPSLYPEDYPDLSLVDTWQYVGYLAPIKSSTITAYPITRVRLRIRYGLSADNYSGSARVMWLADPSLRIFQHEGNPIHDAAISQRVSTINVSNPPTDAELDAAFGTPATVGNNFNILINDNNSDANVYMVRSNGTSWWYTTLTKAV
jgi:hypothetical protein